MFIYKRTKKRMQKIHIYLNNEHGRVIFDERSLTDILQELQRARACGRCRHTS